MGEAAGQERTQHQPALDGLRALAVGLVLAFHMELDQMPGGYLGVSVFFTLSGFLITRLLLNERSASGSVDLGQFYQRRLRRLLPASLLTLAMIVILVRVEVFAASSRLRDEISASALQSLNIFNLFGGSSYADLFNAPSPVAHFWSLGIEEQFYWIWPLALLGLCALSQRRGRSPLAAICVLFVLSGISAVVTAQISPSAAYYAPWTRAAEILAGAALAAWLSGHRPPLWWRHLGLPALVVIVVAAMVTPSGRGWAYGGGLPIFALVSVAMIAGLLSGGRTSRVLAVRPLVLLGMISYGVYLLHWPVFVALDEQRVGLSGASLQLLRLAVTIGLAIVMYVVVEQPIRAPGRKWMARPVALSALASTVVVVLGVALLVQPPPVAPVAERVLGAAPAAARAVAAPPASTAPRPGPPAPTTSLLPDGDFGVFSPLGEGDESASEQPPEPLTPQVIGIFGDSVPAWLLRDAAATFDRTDVTLVNVANEACDAMEALPVGRDRHLQNLALPESCQPWTIGYPQALAEAGVDLDLAVLVLGQAATVDRLVGETWLHPCDGIGWYLDDLGRRISYFRDSGVDVVFALPAHPGAGAEYILPDDANARLDCVRDQLRPFLDERFVRTVDLDDVLCVDDKCDEVRTRDGIHVDPDKAPGVLDWLITKAARSS